MRPPRQGRPELQVRTMKAITLTQPWATLVAIGAKRIETRSWRTPYRGSLAIHAAKGYPSWAKETCFTEPFASVLDAAGIYKQAMPRGIVLATCRLIACVPTRDLHLGRIVECDPSARCEPFPITEQELAFGDYSPGRWAWLLADVIAFPIPIPARGALSLWEWRCER